MKRNAGQIIGIVIMAIGILTFMGAFVVAFTTFGSGDIEKTVKLIPIFAFSGIAVTTVGIAIIGISGSIGRINGGNFPSEGEIFSQMSDLAKKNENLSHDSKEIEEEKMVTCPYCGSKNSSKESRCKYCNGNLK